MPHAPEPDEDDLDAIAPPQPVFHVEQALLGALLLEPHRLSNVTGIAAASFSTAAHATLYTAITTLPPPDPAEHAKNTKWLDRVLATGREQVCGLTASYLHTLVQVSPWPSHAPAYARMVEAEHARRRLLTAAERLVHTVHDVSLPHPVQTVLAEADALAAVVDDIANRFPPRSGVLPRTSAPPPALAPDHTEAVEEEQMLLATATAYPSDIEAVRWLLPDDLTLPLHAGLWQCLTGLARRQEPVDPVTVLWEAQQRGLLDDGSEPGEVLRLLAEPAGSVEHWGGRALQRSLLATAEHTGRRIEAYAGAPANTPFQLVVGARRALADTAAVRTRWQHATAPLCCPPPRRRPAPTTRAGPPTTTAAHAARSTRATR
ncbi:DnaB-like helicase N terminal domain-containing protein [Streptomyces sp. Ag82_O1-12]|uniref:DnaB-like helicase N-terminal domain-containing protein n=1 Tax=unclassified Streptomyces TaxID=2593676 RepID=UPI000BD98D09|nr:MULTISPECIES: DnaB-like helicase N-terminal domain-containing protein [unclassified Streptomyces]SMQ19986.1 DnaB-like helicase N terminal domain-containing protein [Streptomyces sp. Ag82_O1-12]SOD48996.1 DnaB-like helicase N terminal domain-containing protein [Streptomyces sp. Ag82_G6-1]